MSDLSEQERAMHGARADYYSALSRVGNPERRINATEKDFNAGWLAAKEYYAAMVDQSCLVEIPNRARSAEYDVEDLRAERDALKAALEEAKSDLVNATECLMVAGKRYYATLTREAADRAIVALKNIGDTDK